MRLLEKEHFATIFEPLEGTVGVVDGLGNPGDQMIYAATRQLLDDFGKKWITLDLSNPTPVDMILLFGGGNMGETYNECIQLRRAARSLGVPTILLPQSFKGPEFGDSKTFIRERISEIFCVGPEEKILAPDLALGLEWTPSKTKATNKRGIFLRADVESLHKRHLKHSLFDPVEKAKTFEEYIGLVVDYEHVVTDRLHFSIAALMEGRRATLLPNTYHKNRGVWEHWLQDLGCEWANTPLEVL
jgi:exopolysaccharide biosynthesis predicted pyruvyltransferase EpsI